jgi:hypothetical protein
MRWLALHGFKGNTCVRPKGKPFIRSFVPVSSLFRFIFHCCILQASTASARAGKMRTAVRQRALVPLGSLGSSLEDGAVVVDGAVTRSSRGDRDYNGSSTCLDASEERVGLRAVCNVCNPANCSSAS